MMQANWQAPQSKEKSHHSPFRTSEEAFIIDRAGKTINPIFADKL